MLIDLSSPTDQAIRRAAGIVSGGGVVCYPADTVYGLGCAPDNVCALRRILQLKGRALARGVACLVPNIRVARHLATALPQGFSELTLDFWPAPLTLIVRASSQLPPELVGSAKTVALRHPDSLFLQRWMDEIGGALVSTSANRSGEPPSSDPNRLREIFGSGVDLYVEATSFHPTQASTIVDLTTHPPRVVRRGAIAAAVEERLRAL